ncbi:DUF1697 domain-containing protein [Arthrobacter sp. ISL-30]|uniref:DUF1697 domain-containing protein n=1 Tax=Arthrobacter sp. ISL-30 TaxID=2819109 RepID=UPI002034C465|nr:DUF1697 domain-containing protein [Arthrobacter sp. ISL-30]
MSALTTCLEGAGLTNVSTFGASGNVLFDADGSSAQLGKKISAAMRDCLQPGSEPLPALVLDYGQLQAVMDRRPRGFGDEPQKFHSDVIFLLGIDPAQAMSAITPRDGVDEAWQGDGVIYFQRLSARRTKSWLNKTMSSPLYRSMTIRSWSTVVKLEEQVRMRATRTEVGIKRLEG